MWVSQNTVFDTMGQPVWTKAAYCAAGLPWLEKKILENEISQVRERSEIFIFSQGNLEKMKKSQGKVREFQKIFKKDTS